MRDTVIKAAKRGAPGEVSNNIEGRIVEPLQDIYHRCMLQKPIFCQPFQLADKQIYVFGDYCFLFMDRFSQKAGAKILRNRA